MSNSNVASPAVALNGQHTASTPTRDSSTPASSPRLKGLKCRECAATYPLEAKHVCEFCFGPLFFEIFF